MISRKTNYGRWYTSDYQFHKFSGPYIIYQDGDNIYCQYDIHHRLYGSTFDWGCDPTWFVNNKRLNAFKGAKK